MHFSRNGCHFSFGGHFGSYIKYYKTETFLMLYKIFVDIFFYWLLQKLFYVDVKKDFLNQIAVILELAAIASLKGQIRDGNIPSITEYI